jgi:nucleoside-diphosphate-sugar epimerase
MEIIMKNILVTGSSGLIGTILLKKFNKYNLIGIDLKENNYENFEKADISDQSNLQRIMQKNNICTVVHLAGNASVNADWNSLLKNNFNGTFNVFDACKESGVNKIIFASSNHAVGLFENDSPYKQIVKGEYEKVSSDYSLIKPSCEVRPDSLYGVSKAYGENLGRFYFESYGINVACLRIGSVIQDDNPLFKNSNRFFSTWCSHTDISGLIEACIDSDKIGYNIFYGVSDNKWKIWDISNLNKKLSFIPKSNAESFRK